MANHLLTAWTAAADDLGVVLAALVAGWLVILIALLVSLCAECVRLLWQFRSRRQAAARDAYEARMRALAPVLLSEWRGKR